MGPNDREWTQDEIDADMCGYGDDDFDDYDSVASGEECGRWRNGRLDHHCMKAGSEECDWECPYRDMPAETRKKKLKPEPVVAARDINRRGFTKEPVMVFPKKATP